MMSVIQPTILSTARAGSISHIYDSNNSFWNQFWHYKVFEYIK